MHRHHRNNERCDAEVEYIPEGYRPYNRGITELLAAFFEIDQWKVEDEKRAMLDECRGANE
jgi:hypothetical protein